MLKLDVRAWNIALLTEAINLVALIGLRLVGKREIGQMTAFDLVVLLLIANAVQNAMVGPDTSLTGGVLAAVVLLVLNAVVAPGCACAGRGCGGSSRLSRTWKSRINALYEETSFHRGPSCLHLAQAQVAGGPGRTLRAQPVLPEGQGEYLMTSLPTLR